MHPIHRIKTCPRHPSVCIRRDDRKAFTGMNRMKGMGTDRSPRLPLFILFTPVEICLLPSCFRSLRSDACAGTLKTDNIGCIV
jgi:hypothetical protein